jgi:predicted NACHT family NTPase
MAVALIEIGIPFFKKLRIKSPTIAKELTRKRYTFNLREKAQERIDRIAEQETEPMRLNKRVSVGLTERQEFRIRLQARKEQKFKSQIIRERLGLI